MRIVIKVGTNALMLDGSLDVKLLKSLVRQISDLKGMGHEPILVSSGAIGFGTAELGMDSSLRRIEMRQAAAAVGQGVLMEQYRRLFDAHDIKVAQILLTDDVFNQRKRYLNLRNCMHTLLKLGVIPVINENDTVATEEIDKSFGDNDVLSALVTSKMEAQMLIMLTDIDGLYNKDPRKNKKASLLREVKTVTSEMEKLAGKARAGGRGGMQTKLKAAKAVMASGATMVIANAREKDVIARAAQGKHVGTRFLPHEKMSNKKSWIRMTVCRGKLHIDSGAKNALKSGKSLLPAGITEVEGEFSIGDVVEIVCNKIVIARAMTDFSSFELERIKGKHSTDIKKILGPKNYDSVFRRENYVQND